MKRKNPKRPTPQAAKDDSAQLLPVASLIPDPRNAKQHDEAQVAQIAGSIREFGFAAPIIVDEDNNILAGHGRWQAAQKLGLENVPCRRLAGLTKAQRRAFVIADNKLTLNTRFDEELLKAEFADLPAELLALTGFSDDEIKLCLDGWTSDINHGNDDGPASHEIVRLRVAAGEFERAKEIAGRALTEAGIEWSLVTATSN